MISLLIENNNILFRNKAIDLFLQQWYNNLDFIKLTTSGSTKKSKIIYAKKKHLIQSAKITGNFLDLKVGDSALCCLPLDFIAGKMMLIRSLVLKLKLFYVDPSSNPIKDLNFFIDFCAMTPMQVSLSLNKLFFIKKLIIGGSPILHTLKNKLFQFNNIIYESFGMTETYSHFALKKISQFSNLNYFNVLDGFSIEQDYRNCLIVNTPFDNLSIITNDIVKIYNKTFKFLGRFDFVINSGGIKLYPEVIEEKIAKAGYILNTFIISSLYDKQLGEKLILIIEYPFSLKKNQLNFYEKYKNNILIQLKNKLNKYEIPKEIIFIKQFNRTINGKIIRYKII